MRAAPRPDPRKGVFETMLVHEGRPVELEAHLERLATSLDRLYEAELPRGASNEVIARARAIRQGRLRLTVAPGESGELETRIRTAEVEAGKVFPQNARGASLRSVVIDGGLGDHKWADRGLLEAAGGEPGELPLVVDRDGAVLEASRGAVFALLADGRLHTPPTDGRILPSISRRRALELAREEGIEVREDGLALADLLGASEAFLAGSVRGIEPVGSVDDVPLAGPGPVSLRIAAGLRRRWLPAPPAGSAAAASAGRPGDRPER